MNTENRHEHLREDAEAALERAALAARERGKRTRTPVWIWDGSEWMDLNPQPSRYEPKEEPEPMRFREDPEE